jgi:hypothetical protein
VWPFWNAANPYSTLALKRQWVAARTLGQSLEVRALADFDACRATDQIRAGHQLEDSAPTRSSGDTSEGYLSLALC